MESSLRMSKCIATVLVLIFCAAQGPSHVAGAGTTCDKFARIFVIGDSFVDNGNRDTNDNTYTGIGRVDQSWLPPFGRSGPGGIPAGRFSDGKVLSDFLADYMNLKPTPYRFLSNPPAPARAQDGINFAVGGAGVFDNLGFTKTGDQITQLKTVLNSGLYGADGISESLIFYAVSGNDYGAYARNGGSLDPVSVVAFVSSVLNQITADLRVLYNMGFNSFAISKLPPLGCVPASTAANGFTACDEVSNTVATTHNSKLFLQLTTALPGAKLIFLNNQLAFNTITLPGRLKPCCTGLQNGKLCGDVDAADSPQYSVCSPSSQKDFFFWDEFHPTEAGWATIFNLYLQGFPSLFTDGKSLPQFLGCN